MVHSFLWQITYGAYLDSSSQHIVWLVALVEILSGYRTRRCRQTGRTREQTELLLLFTANGVPSVEG